MLSSPIIRGIAGVSENRTETSATVSGTETARDTLDGSDISSLVTYLTRYLTLDLLALIASNRIFDPFYTTKEGNARPGLRMGQAVAEQPQGMILTDMPENTGTRFIVQLPLRGENGKSTSSR